MQLDDETMVAILPRLRKIAGKYHMSDPSIDADDLAQDAVLRLLEGQARGTCAFLATHLDALRYLARVVSSAAIDRQRRAIFRAHAQLDPRARAGDDTEARALEACAVDEALALLAGDPGVAAICLGGIGYREQEIAILLAVPRTTAHKQIYRTRARMAEGRPYVARGKGTAPLTTIKSMP